MFEWLKKRREIKKMKSLKKEVEKSIEVMMTLIDNTILGENTETKSDFSNSEMGAAVGLMQKIVKEIDAEIDDRTRQREPMFRVDKEA